MRAVLNWVKSLFGLRSQYDDLYQLELRRLMNAMEDNNRLMANPTWLPEKKESLE